MLWKMRIPFTFTFEISNGIYDLSDKKGNCIDRDILLRAGSSILAGLMRYCRLEMKIPQVAQAKIDTGINKRKRRVNKINKDTEMFLRTKTSKMSRSKPKKNGKIL